jgi:hypothetical protein
MTRCSAPFLFEPRARKNAFLHQDVRRLQCRPRQPQEWIDGYGNPRQSKFDAVDGEWSFFHSRETRDHDRGD